MNTQPDRIHKTVKQLLDTSLTKLQQPTLAQLRDARAQALARQRTSQVSPEFAWAGNITWQDNNLQHKTGILAAIVLLAILIFGAASYWNQPTDVDTSDVDIAILTDDLPIHVYLE